MRWCDHSLGYYAYGYLSIKSRASVASGVGPLPNPLLGQVEGIRTLCSQKFEILRRGTLDRIERNGGVQSSQSSLVRYRKGQKINVGELSMALNMSPVEPS